jgi:hypothetical protein
MTWQPPKERPLWPWLLMLAIAAVVVVNVLLTV